MICLDTNAVIAAINSRPSQVRSSVRAAFASREALAISTIVLFELRYGTEKSSFKAHNRTQLKEFLSAYVEVLSFDPDDAKEAAEIRAALERAGTPIGAYDILIAAQARRRDALLVTANVREFARVPGLRIEDWTTASP